MISASKSEDLFDALQLLSVLAEIQQWEAANSDFIRGQSSRQLYFWVFPLQVPQNVR